MTTKMVEIKADLKQRSADMIEAAKAAVVESQEDYEAVAEERRNCKTIIKEMHTVLDPFCKAANDHHKAAVKYRSSHIDPLKTADGIYGRKMDSYAEEVRIKEEAKRKEEERKAREQAEHDRAAEAAQLEAEGDIEAAVEVLDSPVMPVASIKAAAPPKASGIMRRENWSAEVTDLFRLIKFVAENPANIDLVQANQKALNSRARSAKKYLNIPGVTAVVDRKSHSKAN